MAKLVIGTDKTVGTPAFIRDISPANYINFDVDANGVLKKASPVLKFEGAKDIDTYALYYAYANNTTVSGDVVATSLEKCSQNYACQYAFRNCTGITSVDFRNLKTVTGTYAFSYAFQGCTGVTSVNLGSLTTIESQNGCAYMFNNCTGITSVSLPSLTMVSGQNACSSMFSGCSGITSVNLSSLTSISSQNGCSGMFNACSGITSVDLSSLTSISGQSGCSTMFNNCTSLTSVSLSKLISVTGTSACSNMFAGCSNLVSADISRLARVHVGEAAASHLSNMFKSTSLTELRFSGLAYTTAYINGAFVNTLSGVTGCTVHFPSDWATTMANYSNITNGLGGTNTTVLFDLPAVTTFDFSYLTSIDTERIYYNLLSVGALFPNVTGVNFSSLVEISGARSCYNMFGDQTAITNIDFSSLTSITGEEACNYMFVGCTGITSVSMPNLTKITGRGPTSGMFTDCTGITSVDLSKLVVVDGYGAMSGTFEGCSSLTQVKFHSLNIIAGGSAMSGLFLDCGSSLELSFPALRQVVASDSFIQIAGDVVRADFHFPSNMQTVIQNLNGYSATAPFGAISGSVLFDLPASIMLIGANDEQYQRNPKYDTATALAWRIKDTGTVTDLVVVWTPFYTSGLTDPTTGTTIYSDAACTTAVTTVNTTY